MGQLLSELIFILKRNNPYFIKEVFPNDSKSKELFRLFLTGKVKTDKEAAELLYPGEDKEKKYGILKRETIKGLTKVVFKTSIYDKSSTNFEKLRFLGKRDLMIVERLLNQNVYHNAEKIVLRVKSYAEKFLILDLQIECIKHLRSIYALKGHPEEVALYNVILTRLNKQFHYELSAGGFIDILDSKTKYSIGKYRKIAEEARQYALQIREWEQEISSQRLNFYQYKIDLMRCYHLNDAREWPYILNRLTDQVHKHPFLQSATLSLYLDLEWVKYQRCVANIPEANAYLDKALQQSEYDAFNRFEVQALHFDLKMKQAQYDEAVTILKDVKTRRQFDLLSAADQAAWALREAYLYLVYLSGTSVIHLQDYFSSFSERFSIAELTAACKPVQKDHKGYNFMLIVIKEALATRTQPHEAESSYNSLMAYYQNYMKDSGEERSKVFLKKFARLIRTGVSHEDFNKENKTRSAQPAPKNFDAAELIPYERLLELFMKKHLFLFHNG